MRPKRLLISDVESRKRAIISALEENEFEVQFEELSSAAYECFDAVIPLTLRDARMINARILQGDTILGSRAIVAHEKVINLTNDKLRFNRFLRRNYREMVPAFSRSAFPRPFLLKKRKDSGGLNTFLIRTEEDELQHQNLIHSDDFFCQDYTQGQVEYTAHFLFDDRILYGFTNMFRMNRDLFVRGEKMKPFTDVQVFAMPLEFGELFETILRQIGFSGFGCFNYKLRDGVPQIFELNARLGGSANYDLANLFRALDRFQAKVNLSEAEQRLDAILANHKENNN